MTATVPVRPTEGEPALRPRAGATVRYLELHLLWGDIGPVARVRLGNPSTVPAIELVYVFAAHNGTIRLIGKSRVRVLPQSAIDGLIPLDRDFPTTGAWLQQDPTATPVQIWAGPAIDRPQITADAP